MPHHRGVTSGDDGRAASVLSHDHLGETSAKAAALQNETIGRVSLQSPTLARPKLQLHILAGYSGAKRRLGNPLQKVE